MAKGDTIYSDKVPGARGDYGWSASFDKTDGYVGINQHDGDKLTDRVLLSAKQVKELIAFVEKR